MKIYCSYLFANQLYNAYIYLSKNGVAHTRCYSEIHNKKTYFDMMKINKSNPIFKRDGVKTELYLDVIEIQ